MSRWRGSELADEDGGYGPDRDADAHDTPSAAGVDTWVDARTATAHGAAGPPGD